MAQIISQNMKLPEKRLAVQSGDPNLEFIAAKELAKQTAQEHSRDAMLLSWYNRKTGEFYPRYDCGGHDRPPWVVFAESRGANLTVDIDAGDYVFMFLLF